VILLKKERIDPRTAELIQVSKQKRSTPTRKKAQTELF